jgi:hypothetical protein
MRNTCRGNRWLQAVALGLLLAGTAQAADDRGGGDDRAGGDEKCVARCDEESDKCMSAAGKDKQAKTSCDEKYSDCLQKCGS